MLLTINEIAESLDRKFIPLADVVTGLRLIPRAKPLAGLEEAERRLGTVFPEPFARFVCTYELDDFSLNNVMFGAEQDYVEMIVAMNTIASFDQWWSGDARPSSWLCIANSDPYGIFLNTDSGEVYAVTSDDEWGSWQCAARDFHSFIRGLGTAYLLPVKAAGLAAEAGSEHFEFWEWAAAR